MYIVFLPLILVGMVFGGEMTVNVDTYKPPMRAETRSKYSVSANPKWRKKVAFKEWANIGHDEEKLFSIIEHYLRDKGFSYRSGVWNHTYIPWEEGFIFRAIGTLFLVVGIFIFSTLDTGILLVNLFPCIHIIIGAWVLLIGLGKIEFYHLIDDNICEAKRQYIKCKFRGKGYARMMLDSMMNQARDLGFKENRKNSE